MKQILVFGFSYSIGGVENYLISVERELQEKYIFEYVIEDTGKSVDDAKRRIREEIIPCAREHMLGYYLHVSKILRKYRGKVDTIYLNVSDFKYENLVILLLAKKNDYKVIIHAHAALGNEIHGNIHRLIHKTIKTKCLNLISQNKVIRLAVSERAGQYLYQKQTFYEVPPGIDPLKFMFSQEKRETVRKKNNIGKEYVIGFIGRLVDVKNPLFALDVFRLLLDNKEYKDSKLMFVGDGPLYNTILQHADDYGIKNNIIMVGFVNDVEAYLSAMDCLIGTSYSEGLPLTILEAVASGLQCVCAKHNYPQELQTLELVSFCPIDEGISAWSSILGRLLKNSGCYDRRIGKQMIIDKQFDKTSMRQKLTYYMEFCELE